MAAVRRRQGLVEAHLELHVAGAGGQEAPELEPLALLFGEASALQLTTRLFCSAV